MPPLRLTGVHALWAVQLYFHRLGAAAEDDVVVMQDDEHPDWRFDADIADDGSVLLISVCCRCTRRFGFQLLTSFPSLGPFTW